MIRIVTSLDFDTDDPKEAYEMLRKLIPEDIGWESTDEWYNNEGERMSVDDIEKTIAIVLDNLPL